MRSIFPHNFILRLLYYIAVQYNTRFGCTNGYIVNALRKSYGLIIYLIILCTPLPSPHTLRLAKLSVVILHVIHTLYVRVYPTQGTV